MTTNELQPGAANAIRVCLNVQPNERVTVITDNACREISDALGIPYHFLAKIVQTLTGAGLLQSMRGPTGGVALARPATRITLKEIVLALDGPAVCPLHDQWAPARAQVERMFSGATLADTAARIQAGDYRLAALSPS